MPPSPFIFVSPGATRGIGLALTRHFLQTTNIPVFTTTRRQNLDDNKQSILRDLDNVDPDRLSLLPLDCTSESSIYTAANTLKQQLEAKNLENPYLQTCFITGGMLVPEKQPLDLDLETLHKTFGLNVISHLLMIKHFSQFLPPMTLRKEIQAPSKWAHITARVGSIEDNKLGGWYSYRASKAALNQVIKTFDIQLQQRKVHAVCVGVHPGTVKTDLSRDFWGSTENLFEPEDAAKNIASVVDTLEDSQRGQCWDWAGKRIPW